MSSSIYSTKSQRNTIAQKSADELQHIAVERMKSKHDALVTENIHLKEEERALNRLLNGQDFADNQESKQELQHEYHRLKNVEAELNQVTSQEQMLRRQIQDVEREIGNPVIDNNLTDMLAQYQNRVDRLERDIANLRQNQGSNSGGI